MTAPLEFPYRHKAKVVFWLLTSFTVLLACLGGLTYILFAGELSAGDFASRRGGKALVAIPFAVAFVVLAPIYLIRAQRGVLRVTPSELTAGIKTLPIREIRKIDVRQAGLIRCMYVHTGNPKLWAMISEGMLPNARAFDEVQQALLRSRTDWTRTGTSWSVR